MSTSMPLDYLLICGLYGIRCKANGRYYIGRSTLIGYRAMSHVLSLLNETHDNKELAADFRKYGVESFEVLVLDECSPNKLINAEWERVALAVMEGDDLYNHEAIRMRSFYEKHGAISRIHEGSLKFYARQGGTLVETDSPIP